MDLGTSASRLTAALGLDRQPVAVAFVDDPVAGVEEIDRAVPSACAFWRHAADACFYAPAAAHMNCPIGALTMGFELPGEVAVRLGEAVELMTAAGYLGASEPANLPRVDRPSAGIVYGPLADFPLAPDRVLVWMSPRSAMLFTEAQDGSRWDAGGGSPVLGRPGCAAIPAAATAGTAVSFGCSGMRTFTEIADSLLLGVIAGAQLEEVLDGLERVAAANGRMLDHYQVQAASFGG